MNEEEILAMVKKEMAEALGRPLADIAGDKLLRGDLGVESIDLIDLTFRFEKALGRPLSEEEVFRPSRENGDTTVHDVALALSKNVA